MSSFLDVAGTEEGKRKEKTPKEYVSCGQILGHTVKNCMTVIRNDGALSDKRYSG